MPYDANGVDTGAWGNQAPAEQPRLSAPQTAPAPAAGGTDSNAWGAIGQGAGSIGSSLLTGILQSKMAEEAAARTEYQRQQDRLWSLQNAQYKAPLQGAEAQGAGLQRLMQNWGMTKR